MKGVQGIGCCVKTKWVGWGCGGQVQGDRGMREAAGRRTSSRVAAAAGRAAAAAAPAPCTPATALPAAAAAPQRASAADARLRPCCPGASQADRPQSELFMSSLFSYGLSMPGTLASFCRSASAWGRGAGGDSFQQGGPGSKQHDEATQTAPVASF